MNRSIKTTVSGAILGLLLAGISQTYGQLLDEPRASQKGKISQRVGITDITIKYHRPLVKDREIWGALVPYNEGKPFPWRAGANENTTISFTHDVKVEGENLKAGTYGLHMIPAEDEWTVIFSKNSTSWGSFSYNQDEDALRVTVKPEKTHMRELLTFSFDEVKTASTVATMSWEKLKVSFNIEVDVHNIVVAKFNNQLRSVPGFLWQGWNRAAQYTLDNDHDLEQGLKWAEQSLTNQFAGDKNFTTLKTKAEILAKLDREEESMALMEEALPLGKVGEIHFYGRSLIKAEKFDEALEIFKSNQEKHPSDTFTVWVGLARGYQALGEKDMAIENWKMAIEGAQESQKPFYKKILADLEMGE